MDVFEKLNLGEKYSKKELSEILSEAGVSFVQEGVFSCKNSNSYFLFVDLGGLVDTPWPLSSLLSTHY